MLMGFIFSAILDSEAVIDGRHQNPAKCRCITIGYKYHGKDVCRKTFFCIALGRIAYKEEGLQTRIHKNTKHSPYHAMPFDATSYVLTFLQPFYFLGVYLHINEMTLSFYHLTPAKR